MISPTCVVEGCGKPVHARGMCSQHYKRWKRENPELVGRRLARGDRPLPSTELVRLRRLVGVPDDGPTAEQMATWRAQESAELEQKAG